MAIPDSPNWSSLKDIKAYPIPDFIKPPALDVVHDISLGPIALNVSKGKLNSRYWVVYQEAGNVNIAGAIDGEWQPAIAVFTEPVEITKISLTFDQLGRTLVFYNTDTSDLKLYWYNPVTETSEVKSLGIGYDPVACFDFPQDTNQSFSDMLVFYVRGQQVYMRIQRDRFDIEYECPANQPGITITSAGLRVDNRLQVVYEYVDGDYEPPIVPMPPIIVEGSYGYQSGWGTCFQTLRYVDATKKPFKLGFTVANVQFPEYTEIGASAYKQKQNLFTCNAPKALSCHVTRDTRSSLATLEFWCGGTQSFGTFTLDSFVGNWHFEYLANEHNLKITKDAVVVFNQVMGVPVTPGKSSLALVFGGGRLYFTGHGISFHGTMKDCWVENDGALFKWPLTEKDKSVHDSIPAGHILTIFNYKPENWKFIAS